MSRRVPTILSLRSVKAERMKARTAITFLVIAFAGLLCNRNPLTDDIIGPTDPGPLLFISNKSGTYQLYSMKEDGSEVKQLTNDPDFPINYASWSPDGTMIAITSLLTSSTNNIPSIIYVMNADGTGLRRLTNHDLEDYPPRGSSPIWSPDSKIIAYSKALGFEGSGGKIFTVNADGTNSKRVSSSNNLSEAATDWSPDGQLLLVGIWGDPYFTQAVVTMTLDGVHQATIGDTTAFTTSGRWSPDQHSIVFTSIYEGRQELFISKADGSDKKLLPTSSKKHNYAVDWSPAGDRILLKATNGSGQDGKLLYRTYVKNIQTGELIDITPFKGSSVYSHFTSWRQTNHGGN